MKITTRKKENALVISVKGRLDAVSCSEFEEEMGNLIVGGDKNFIIDFTELDYISSAGLRSLLTISKKLKEMEGHIFLSSLKDTVREVFDISGFSLIIPIYDTVGSALLNI